MSNVNPESRPQYPQNVTPSQGAMETTSEPELMLSGWTVFSGVMLLLAGAFGSINGVIALLNRGIYVSTENGGVLLSFQNWGWIHALGGLLVAIIGLVVLTSAGAWWARFLGVFIAGAQALGQIAFINAYPWWTIATITFDILIIYGLLVAPRVQEPERYASMR